ncbi:DEAD/DEAH box helicase (plasmid) [Mycolicibacterium aubagnense]|uniref:DEAD/DEAH box helicase n=1 Tax=Mycolicibacterium aubagnense TaxID=319707 RepID=UPI00244DD433|nr:DEAD/DEAH box helicase [Mycolicibacterium aubagnense]WGI36003.1 DEAD/DEAH box helicase [Mycolicibacterium aubagnense]
MSARTVGQFEWHPRGVWEVSASPDIMVRAKRWFLGAMPTTRGTIIITANLEAARDLECFIDRYPMRASEQDRRRLRSMAWEHRENERTVQEILAGGSAPVGSGPGWVSSAIELRESQRVARDLVWKTGGVLIADRLGAGKTLMALSLLENPEARPALAVTYAGLMPRQWRRELAKFYPDLTSVEVQVGPIHSLKRRGRTADLIVMNYAKLAKWQHHLRGLVRTVIFDEVHELRGETSDRYKAAVSIAHAAQWRVGLSGTPVFNYGGTEMYNIIDALRPGVLGSREEFAREWCGGASSLGPKTRLTSTRAFRSYMKTHGLLLKRRPSELGIDLPEPKVIEQSVPSDPEVLRRIEGNAVALARLILDQSASGRERWSAAGQFDVLLRQSTGIAKAPFVADVVRLLLQTEKRVILLGYHHACHNIWGERLADFKPVFYTGRQSVPQKAAALQAFESGRSRLLIMSVRSGAGLDGLQKLTRTVVFGELDWSPAPHAQAIGRVDRPGQTEEVQAIFCITDTGADPVMLETLDVKKTQFRGLIELDEDDYDEDVSDQYNELEPVMTPDRYALIQRIAANYLAQVGQDDRRTA